MARTSTPWRLLPARELGCGSPATCWRRLTEWAKAGVFDALHLKVWTSWGPRVGWTGHARAWTRPACAPSAGDHVGANPVDRGKPGSKLHLVCDGGGLPLTAVVTAANVNDTTTFQAVVDDIPLIRTPSGRRRCRPGKLHADKGYDSALIVSGCGGVGSGRGSPGVGSSRRRGWDGIGGRSSDRCHG
jgi:hypothetical protein